MRLMAPSLVDWEDMYSMPSTPLISCSIGAATVAAITFGVAPGYAARTITVGGVTAGYSLRGSRTKARAPATSNRTEMTIAKVGRPTKKCGRSFTGRRGRRTSSAGAKNRHGQHAGASGDVRLISVG